MSRWHYDLYGAEPIERYVPVYDTALIDIGEMVMLGVTDPDSNADHGVAFVTAFVASSAMCVDTLGVSLMKRNTAGPAPAIVGDVVGIDALPDIANPPYNKCIINPGAVYLSEYDQADTMAVASSSTTTITVTSLEDDIDTGWIFMVTATVSGNDANLRQLTASASGSATMDAALTGGNETSGTAIKILPVNHRFVDFSAAAVKIATDAAIGDCVSLHNIENYVADDGLSFQPLRASRHRGLVLTNNARFFSDIALLDHVYKNT